MKKILKWLWIIISIIVVSAGILFLLNIEPVENPEGLVVNTEKVWNDNLLENDENQIDLEENINMDDDKKGVENLFLDNNVEEETTDMSYDDKSFEMDMEEFVYTDEFSFGWEWWYFDDVGKVNIEDDVEEFIENKNIDILEELDFLSEDLQWQENDSESLNEDVELEIDEIEESPISDELDEKEWEEN